MTGTSCDGIDVAFVHMDRVRWRASILEHIHATFPSGAADLGQRLRQAREQVPLCAIEWAQLARDAATAHIQAIEPLVTRHGTPDLIVLHGQTVAHAPPLSWQLCDPFRVAHHFATRTVYDLRAADLAAGGHGAPLVPFADWVLFRAAAPRTILNLGGFANATFLPGDCDDPHHATELIRGGDLCACCQWLDAVARRVLHEPFDRGGASAARGRANAAIAEHTATALAPDADSAHQGSLGTRAETALANTLEHFVEAARAEGLTPEDHMATATEVVGQAIARSLARTAGNAARSDLIVAGGGAENVSLLAAIARSTGCRVRISAECGVAPAAREAAAWAILGACRDACRITIPAVTGRGAARLIDGAEIRPIQPV